ncbi:MAG TPA: nitroreductase family protein [Candidatus Desulfaltia sp.]|nr:nitroreductase family protein [Candidatus Desulfaltia sp.]
MSGKTKVKSSGGPPFFDVVEQRVSVRKYKQDPVPEEHLDMILDAARLAPNSGNQQACRYLVVRDREKLEALKEDSIRNRMRWLEEEGYDVPEESELRERYDDVFSAPVYVLVLVDKTVRYEGYTDMDGSLAAGHIMLAARALGYGTVFYSGSVTEELCRKHFGISEKYKRVCMIPIGVPDEWPERRKRLPLKKLVFYEKIT